jgi:hypothetical protein
MRRLLITAAMLSLAGCQAPAPADNTPQPNESVVEDELQNEQLNQAEAIQNEAATDNDNADPDDGV